MTIENVCPELEDIVAEVGAQVREPPEAEDFFVRLLHAFDGGKGEFLEYVRSNVGEWFRCVRNAPDWVQSPKWQFCAGKPMVFVGQIDVLANTGWFREDARFFVFWSPDTGDTKTLVQTG